MAINSAIGVISRWGSTADSKLFVFDSDRKQIHEYLKAVDKIQRSLASTASSDHRSKAESAIQIAMPRLSDEFRNILEVNSKSTSSLNPYDTCSTTMTDSNPNNYEVYEDDYVNKNSMSNEAIDDLWSIALRMNSSGCLHDCVNMYVSERKSVVNADFQRLRVQKLSKNSAQSLEWEVLALKFNTWIKAAKICFKYYFDFEKQLCEQIFYRIGNNTAEACFMEIVKDYATQLFEAAETFRLIRPESERIFKFLDLYGTLSGLLPQINKLFYMQSSESLRTKPATEILPKLADAVNEILLQFENSLVNEKSPIVRGDQIHSLPKYVMYYVYRLFDHKQVLMGLSLSNPPSTDVSRMRFESSGFKLKFEGQNQFSLHIIWIIMSLVSGLEIKATKDHFFAMNNLCYIVQMIIELPELREIVGDINHNKLIGKCERAKGDYLRSTFGEVLNCLRDEGLKNSGILSSRASKLTERLKNFNSELVKVHRDLAKLVVPDSKLAMELRESVGKMLVGAYTNFLLHLQGVSFLKKEVKYSRKELDIAIKEFW